MQIQLNRYGHSGLRAELMEGAVAIALGSPGTEPGVGKLLTKAQKAAVLNGLPATVAVAREIGPFRVVTGLTSQQVQALRLSLLGVGGVALVTPVFFNAHDSRQMPLVPTGTIHIRVDQGGLSNAVVRDAVQARCARRGYGLTLRQDDVLVARAGDAARAPDAVDAVSLAHELESLSGVLHAEPDFVAPLSTLPDPVPPGCGSPRDWHLGVPSTPVAAGPSTCHANVKAAWDRLHEAGRPRHGSPSIKLAALDFGFDLRHQDFQSPGPPEHIDFLGSPPAQHHVDHGTAVAGLAWAATGASEAHGVAPGCTALCLTCRTCFSDAALSSWFEAARRANTAVLNCSWRCDADYWAMSVELALALERSAALGRGGRGMVVVFAAGNDSSPVVGLPDYRNDWPMHPSVLGVGALASNGIPADYSNVGHGSALFAPSSGNGRALLTTGGGAAYCGFGGTSGAAPIVAGVAALVLTAKKSLCARCVREVLMDSAQPLPDCKVPTAPGEAFPVRLVDAEAAVLAAMRRTCAHPQATAF